MSNPLFPIFLKANQLKVLIVGGGYVALEKLTALWNNSKDAEVILVAPTIQQEIKEYLTKDKKLTLLELNRYKRQFENSHFNQWEISHFCKKVETSLE